MTDYQPITDADLETGSPAPPEQGGLSPKYQPINDNDVAPTGPAGQTSEFAYKGIPAAAAARFKASNPLTNIAGAVASKYANGFVSDFNALNAKDQQLLLENGYGQYGGPGGLLQHFGDTLNAGATLLKNFGMAAISAIPEAGAGLEGQIARETGASEVQAASAEREGGFTTMAALSDVNSQIEAARIQATAPGVWGTHYRVDRTPDGLEPIPMGRLPNGGAEAAVHAQVAADALHLPPETATLIHQTYLDTGRPPAEVLMDAQTNHGGVLDDLVAGKVPTTYQGPARPMTSEELEAAAPKAQAPEGVAANVKRETQPVETQSGVTPEAPTGISKIGQSIEAKAVEDGLTKGFAQTAGYDKITIADQAERTAALINGNLEQARAVVRGEQPLPEGMKGTALITAMEEYIKKNPSEDLAYELANSPLVSATSGAAQELRLAAERTPDSAAARLQEIRAAQEKAAGGSTKVAQKVATTKAAIKEANSGIFLPKQALRWENFLDEIKC